MKTRILFVLLLIFLMSATACTKEDASRPTSTVNLDTPFGTSTITPSKTEPAVSTIVPPDTAPTTLPVTIPDPNTITVFSIDGPQHLTVTRKESIIASVPTEYGWAYYDGRIFLAQYDGACELSSINGSERYICASVSDMTGIYCYILDAQTGAVCDPLAAVGLSVRERISEIKFSACGSYALIFTNSSTAAILFDGTSEISVPLPVAEDIYSVTGFFCDNSHILLISSFQNAQGEFHYTYTRYNILTREAVSIPGKYQAADKNKDNFMHFSEDGILYTYVEGQLAIMDPLTWETTVYPFPDSATVSYYTSSTYIVNVNGVRYLCAKNGTYRLIDAS